MLTSKFDKFKINDDETFDEFYARLNGILNWSFNHKEKIPDNKILGKDLGGLTRSLGNSSDLERD